MKAVPTCTLVLASFLFAGTASVWAQTPPAPSSSPAKSAATTPARPAAQPTPGKETSRPAAAPDAAKTAVPATATPPPRPASPATGAGVQQLVSEFGEQRQDRLDQRRALLERLQAAKNEEEKKRIIAELRQQQQQRLEQQRELARQIREQLQNSRGDVRPAGPGG